MTSNYSVSDLDDIIQTEVLRADGRDGIEARFLMRLAAVVCPRRVAASSSLPTAPGPSIGS